MKTRPDSRAPLLVVTPGEPAGIGPDLVIASALARTGQERARLVIASDPALLQTRARQLGVDITVRSVPAGQVPSAEDLDQALCVWPVPGYQPVQPGRPAAGNARHVLATLDLAVAACRDGTAEAMVTGPIQKSAIIEGGYADFSGHTEYLAHVTGAPLPVMMLVAPHAQPGPLRVALVTTHLPLRAVPEALTPALLKQSLQVLLHDLQASFGIAQPRVAVTGLNPHAGESGHLGREEIDCIAPVIHALRAEGAQVEGPLPADTLFTPRHLQAFDAVLTMYHDQGLPVLKYAGFGTAVNLTLGLPILRASVDHGTALDLAGTGTADGGSFSAAIAMAAELCHRRRA
ncbi:4-hydroxythreonine-4-phosphate dehydrogenase PdxA [Algiphilus sp.]|uniref:4-hydroxythreonine-4-phosphate dehydrogenase PdxA n=1 Tax=Algiphilus sp. TaxID=1872431 RepID=UPI003B519EE6